MPPDIVQTQQYTTNAPGGTTLNWSVDGVAWRQQQRRHHQQRRAVHPADDRGGGSALRERGQFDQSLSDGSARSRSRIWRALPTTTSTLRGPARTYRIRIDAGRGVGRHFRQTLVVSARRRRRYAQPLYVANLPIGGGTHNVMFVATMHDTVYAFDADNASCTPYWHVSFINGTTITTQSSASAGCDDILDEFGINGTPVIDLVLRRSTWSPRPPRVAPTSSACMR